MVGITLKHAISPTNKIANTRQEQLITQYVIRLQLTPVAHLAAKTSDENTADKQTAAKQMQTKCGKSGKVVDDDFFPIKSHAIGTLWIFRKNFTICVAAGTLKKNSYIMAPKQLKWRFPS